MEKILFEDIDVEVPTEGLKDYLVEQIKYARRFKLFTLYSGIDFLKDMIDKLDTFDSLTLKQFEVTKKIVRGIKFTDEVEEKIDNGIYGINKINKICFGYGTSFYNRIIQKGIYGNNHDRLVKEEELFKFANIFLISNMMQNILKGFFHTYAQKYSTSNRATMTKTYLEGEYKTKIIQENIPKQYDRAFKNLELICKNIKG